MTTPFLAQRQWQLTVAVACGVAFVGFAVGVNRNEYQPRSYQSVTHAPAGELTAPRAVAYSEVGNSPRGPNGLVHQQILPKLHDLLPTVFDSVDPKPQDRADALAKRATRRAYDGAPPTIPHRVRQAGAPDCLVCHEGGARIGDLTAPRMSHPTYASCTQCHVESDSSVPDGTPGPDDRFPNTFEGRPAPSAGTRAWPGAPPTIPHSTRMRGTCDSCHGVAGALGIRTPHPARQSCTQCHAPAAGLDQRPLTDPRPIEAVRP